MVVAILYTRLLPVHVVLSVGGTSEHWTLDVVVARSIYYDVIKQMDYFTPVIGQMRYVSCTDIKQSIVLMK